MVVQKVVVQWSAFVLPILEVHGSKNPLKWVTTTSFFILRNSVFINYPTGYCVLLTNRRELCLPFCGFCFHFLKLVSPLAAVLNSRREQLIGSLYTNYGPCSSVGIATGYGLDVPESNPCGGEIFRACPDRLWGPPSFLYNGYRVFPGVKSGRGVTPTPHPLLVPWSWKGRALPLLPQWAVQPVQSLSACTRVHFTFTFTYRNTWEQIGWATQSYIDCGCYYSTATCSTLLRLLLLQQDIPKPCRVLLHVQATTRDQCCRCRRHVRWRPMYALVRSGRRHPPVEACVRLFASQVYSSLSSLTAV